MERTAEIGVRPGTAPRRMVALDRGAALRLLGSTQLGRVVFTMHALPAIRPVNHLLLDGVLLIRTHEDAALAAVTGHGPDGAVVAYQADAIDPVTHLGWSVVVTGYARPVTDPAVLDRCRALLRPWTDAPLEHAVRIDPE
ncbi:pyridoxamine 5'-phosphate oxidase family protein, partial [Kitasatospora sp. NPDC058965]|uniref:pyridoxamine 5'-phosphate oxidase family protein n=1 Tax=Kitasatospora sp. NPDC058965 TaxID=3346682 RepID=UPI00369BE97A